jgi:hypothetical protein
MRRMTEVYAQLAADRDHQARLCTEFVLSGEWDQASGAGRKYRQLAEQCERVIEGRIFAVQDPPEGA